MQRIIVIALSSALATVSLASLSALSPEPAAAACTPPPAAAVVDALDIDELHARGLTGAGVKIGVISTSFNNATTPQPTTESQDIAAGALPGPGNPCGWERPVTVLSDNSPNDDEGRAMLQIVHAIAPAAELYFATADVTESATVSSDQSIADAIDSMMAAGVDIIVDDMMEVYDTAFSEGLSAAAARRASEAGIAYVVLAGNLGFVGASTVDTSPAPSGGYQIASYTSTAFRAAPCPAEIIADAAPMPVECHDFDPGPGVDTTQSYTLEVQSDRSPELYALVEWGDQPYNLSNTLYGAFTDASTGALTDLLIPGTTEAAGAPLSTGTVFGALGYTGPPAAIYPGRDLLIVREADTALTGDLPIRFEFWSNNSPRVVAAAEWFTSTTTDTFGSTIVGRSANPSSITIAARPLFPALDVICPPLDPSVFGLECFSSTGPQTRYWGALNLAQVPPAPLPAPETRVGPTITAYDGIPTTFFGMDVGGQWLFYGTSAATPTAGGVLALGMQAAPDARVGDLVAALQETASDRAAPMPWNGVTRESAAGAGFIAPVAFIDAVHPAPAPTPDPTAAAGGATLAEGGAESPAPIAVAASVIVGAGLLLLLRRRRSASSLQHEEQPQ